MLDTTHRCIRRTLARAVVTSLLCAAGSGTLAAQDAPLPAGNHFELVFSDEFAGDALDRTKWCTRLAFGGGATPQIYDAECMGPGGYGGSGDFLRDEKQRYRDTNTLNEVLHVVSDGTLKLRATKTGTDSYAEYESSLIRSKYLLLPSANEKFFLSVRVKQPSVRGTFTAMWLAPSFDPDGGVIWPPEIDTFEGALNEQDDRVDMLRLGGVYVKGPQTSSGMQDISYAIPGYDAKWNNYFHPSSLRDVWLDIGVEWSSEAACTYVDGRLIVCQNYRWLRENGQPGAPAQLILNLAIGGQWAGRYGIATDKFPTAMEIDYVRIYHDTNGVLTPLPAAGAAGTGSTVPPAAGTGAAGTGAAGEPAPPPEAGAGGAGGATLEPTTPPLGDLTSFFLRYWIKRLF